MKNSLRKSGTPKIIKRKMDAILRDERIKPGNAEYWWKTEISAGK